MMLNDNELKDMADKMELPLKEGAWDFIESQIPNYPTKRRFLFLWKYFTGALLLVSTAFAIWYHKPHAPKPNSSASQVSSQKFTQTYANTSVQNTRTNIVSPQTNVSNTTPNPVNPVPQLSRRSPVLSPVSPLTIGAPGLTKISDLNEVTSPQAQLDLTNSPTALSGEDFNNRYMTLARIKRYLSLYFHQPETVTLKENKASKFHYFVGVHYALLNSNIHIEPELMKLPKGRGTELNLYAGLATSKWKWSLGIHSAQFTQTTSMGDQHDTTYMQVFRPNFETVLPSEYAGRLHDTSKLYLAGTNHNKVNQSFKVFGLSLNVGRTLWQGKQLALDINYGANYKLLTKANTFFYDSINRAAVPFTQMDKGIVFKNLLSSRVRLGLQYQINSALKFEVSPFIDYFHKPFIKHYYKADFLNYGISAGLNYTIN